MEFKKKKKKSCGFFFPRIDLEKAADVTAGCGAVRCGGAGESKSHIQ